MTFYSLYGLHFSVAHPAVHYNLPAGRQGLFLKIHFSKLQKELPLVAFLNQVLLVFLAPGFPFPSGLMAPSGSITISVNFVNLNKSLCYSV